jgi:glycosyl transferase family 25
MKIFIINLEKSAARRKRMVQVMNDLKLEYTFIEAVDGYALPEKILTEHVKVDHQFYRSFTPGEVGCFMSHLSVYKRIVDEKLPYALVFEDDVKLSPRLPGLLKNIKSEIKQGDVISLYTSIHEPCSFFKGNIIDKNYFYIKPYPDERIIGAVAYIITQDAAQKLLENIYPMDTVIDDWHCWLQRKLINDFKIVFPHPVDIVDVYSDIDDAFGNINLRLKKFIVSYKIPLISQMILKRRRERRLEHRKKRIFIDNKNPAELFY